MAYGKSIELFLVNGSADRLITAELSNWNGKAIKIPRIEVNDCDREDFKQPGVYFLFCKEDDGSESVYIGEAENVKERLVQHLRDYNSEKELYYWNTAVVFTGRDLNKALIRYLEHRFVTIARACKRYLVLTKNTYSKTVMKESQEAVMEEFIDNVKILISTLGYKVLDPMIQPKNETSTASDETQELSMKMINSGASGKGIVTAEGFVLFKGARVNKEHQKSLSLGMRKLRDKILATDKIKDGVTVEDILFSSSSAAASFIVGCNLSGPLTWKTQEGRTLKEITEKRAK